MQPWCQKILLGVGNTPYFSAAQRGKAEGEKGRRSWTLGEVSAATDLRKAAAPFSPAALSPAPPPAPRPQPGLAAPRDRPQRDPPPRAAGRQPPHATRAHLRRPGPARPSARHRRPGLRPPHPRGGAAVNGKPTAAGHGAATAGGRKARTPLLCRPARFHTHTHPPPSRPLGESVFESCEMAEVLGGGRGELSG